MQPRPIRSTSVGGRRVRPRPSRARRHGSSPPPTPLALPSKGRPLLTVRLRTLVGLLWVAQVAAVADVQPGAVTSGTTKLPAALRAVACPRPWPSCSPRRTWSSSSASPSGSSSSRSSGGGVCRWGWQGRRSSPAQSVYRSGGTGEGIRILFALAGEEERSSRLRAAASARRLASFSGARVHRAKTCCSLERVRSEPEKSSQGSVAPGAPP